MINLKELLPNDKKTIYIIAGVLIAGFLACYMLSGLSDNGARIDAIRADLQSVGQQQQAATKRLDDIEAGLNSSAAEAGRISTGLGDTARGIVSVENRIESSQTKLTDSAGLIAEGQQILRSIRERGQTGSN